MDAMSGMVIQVRPPQRDETNDKRVNEATGERKRFSSAVLPPRAHKPSKISELLPPLHLHGLPSGDFVPVPEQFLGFSADLSPAAITVAA